MKGLLQDDGTGESKLIDTAEPGVIGTLSPDHHRPREWSPRPDPDDFYLIGNTEHGDEIILDEKYRDGSSYGLGQRHAMCQEGKLVYFTRSSKTFKILWITGAIHPDLMECLSADVF